MGQTLVEWIVGGMVVLLQGYDRFSEPHYRFTTTRARYFGALIGYQCTLLFLFVLIGGSIAELPAITQSAINALGFTAGETSEGSPAPGEIPGPLYAALIVGVVLSRIARMSDDRITLKRFFYSLGDIPKHHENLRSELFKNVKNYETPSDLQESVNRTLGGLGLANLEFSPYKDLAHRIEMAIAMHCALERCSTESGTGHPIKRMEPELIAAQASFKRLKELIKAGNDRLMEKAGQDNRATEDWLESLDRRLDSYLYQHALALIARIVLGCETGKSARESKLQELGFADFTEFRPPLNVHQFAGIGLGLFATILVITIAASYLVAGEITSVTEVVIRAIMVPLIMTAAVIAAIYPKSTWAFFDINQQDHRPVLAYILSGVIAAVIGMMIALTFRYMESAGEFMAAFDQIWWRYPWMLLSFTLALAVSVMADGYGTDQTPATLTVRLLEACSLGILMLCVGWFVVLWLGQLAKLEAAPENFVQDLPKLHQVLPVLLVAGGIIGYFVPHWYRSKAEDNR